MKVSKSVRAIIGTVGISLISAIHTFAIEGIQLSVQSSNVLLSWPSATNETYIVQSLQALTGTDTWTTLTDLFPAALDTNLTVFVASNSVNPTIWITNSGGGGTNSGGLIPPGGGGTNGGVSGYATGFYRVVRDGVHIFGLTNGAVASGTIQQPIEFSVGSTDEIIGLSFYDTNRNTIIGASAAPGPAGGWTFTWDTAMVTNGNYAVQAELDFGTDAPVVSPPVTVTVSNLISFPNYLTQEFGYWMWIYAQTVPNADVEIDMYDENTNYLGSFFPISDANGVISFNWNLTDTNGNPLSDTNYFGYWTLFLPASDASAAVSGSNLGSPVFAAPSAKMTLTKLPLSKVARPNLSRSSHVIAAAGAVPAGGSGNGPGGVYNTNSSSWWNYEIPWSPNGNWVVAAGDFTTPIANPDANQIEDNIVWGGSSKSDEDGGAYGTLLEAHANIGPPGNSHLNPGLFVVSDPTTRNTLLSFLAMKDPYYSNFYWFGHGNAAALGAIEPGAAMTQAQIAFALDNVPLSLPTAHVAGHPYRFVWAEGCDTTAGTLSEAFACPAKLLSTNDFVRVGIWSRAFLGYPTDFHPDLDQNGFWPEESEIINTLLVSFLRGKSGGIGTQYNLNVLGRDANLDIGPFAQIDYWLHDVPGIDGAGDLLYGDNW